MNWLRFFLLTTLAAVVAAGCGGGTGGTGTGSPGRVTTYITDSMDGNDHVWVTIYRVELGTTPGTSTVVFDDSAGRIVDLRSLRDGTGARFGFLGIESADSGTYTKARITMARNMTIYPAGQSTGEQRSFAPAFTVAGQGNRSRVDLTFTTPKVVTTGGIELVLDFDLAQWVDDGSLVTPVMREGGTGGLDDEGRHERHSFHGTIGSLSGTAPNQSFVLAVRNGFRFNVVTSDRTRVYQSNGAPNPTLANGQAVEVEGVYSRTADALRAHSVRIRQQGDNRGEAEVKGEPSNVGVSTFDVSTRRVRGFQPVENVVHVATGAQTRFFSDGGVPMTEQEFYAALGTAQAVEAEGSFSGSTNTLTAAKVKLEDGEGEHEAEAKGTPSQVDANAGTFKVTLVEWFGFGGSVGGVLDVSTTQMTTYRDRQGSEMSAGDFFAALGTSPAVEVEGHYMNGALVARKAKLDD